MLPVSNLGNLPIAGAVYYRLSTSIALNTIVAPASNTRGIIVHTALLSPGTNLAQRLMTKQTDPSAWNDTGALTILAAFVPSTGVPASGTNLSRPVFIPPGWGLYEQPSGANTAMADVCYEVL